MCHYKLIMTFELHEEVVPTQDKNDGVLSRDEEARRDYEIVLELEDYYRRLQEGAASHSQEAVRRLSDEGEAIKAEINKIVTKYSDKIPDSTEPF